MCGVRVPPTTGCGACPAAAAFPGHCRVDRAWRESGSAIASLATTRPVTTWRQPLYRPISCPALLDRLYRPMRPPQHPPASPHAAPPVVAYRAVPAFPGAQRRNRQDGPAAPGWSPEGPEAGASDALLDTCNQVAGRPFHTLEPGWMCGASDTAHLSHGETAQQQNTPLQALRVTPRLQPCLPIRPA